VAGRRGGGAGRGRRRRAARRWRRCRRGARWRTRGWWCWPATRRASASPGLPCLVPSGGGRGGRSEGGSKERSEVLREREEGGRRTGPRGEAPFVIAVRRCFAYRHYRPRASTDPASVRRSGCGTRAGRAPSWRWRATASSARAAARPAAGPSTSTRRRAQLRPVSVRFPPIHTDRRARCGSLPSSSPCFGSLHLHRFCPFPSLVPRPPRSPPR
jgi:hypothetical protein